MSAQAIIERCASAGLKLWIADNGALRYSGNSEALDLMRAELSTNKAEILKVLAANSGGSAVEAWLADKLTTGVQIASALHREAELLGFSASQLEEARLSIGGRISSMIGGFLWWPSANATLKLAPAVPAVNSLVTDLGLVTSRLKSYALELGYQWADLLGAGLIDDGEIIYAAQNWRLHSQDEWRGYVDSIGTRARKLSAGARS